MNNAIRAPILETTTPVKESSVKRLPERPIPLNQADLQELCELIDTVWLRGYKPSPAVDQIVATANRVGSDFTSRLAMRALRLEQALIVAQERIIRLAWKRQVKEIVRPDQYEQAKDGE